MQDLVFRLVFFHLILEDHEDTKKTFRNRDASKMQDAVITQDSAHHLGMNYYVNFLGRLGSNVFQLI